MSNNEAAKLPKIDRPAAPLSDAIINQGTIVKSTDDDYEHYRILAADLIDRKMLRMQQDYQPLNDVEKARLDELNKMPERLIYANPNGQEAVSVDTDKHQVHVSLIVSMENCRPLSSAYEVGTFNGEKKM